MVPEGPTIPGTGGEPCVNPRKYVEPAASPPELVCIVCVCVLDFRPMLVISARIFFWSRFWSEDSSVLRPEKDNKDNIKS